ncbi:hypothetical protein SAMN05444166_8056 [Singulisphaera sp. GP187]|uniref:hypothetical protein n=1 Tax=Singulisphaera sp. GP187 TaxID=1882752 RepID=UPI00092BB408|nr:hypothetical protein [Singulisphaera sp. GP187]SIO66367.1 hypothetical protein SAMN05444166_8056 [Singulisphaera sp. GP187]
MKDPLTNVGPASAPRDPQRGTRGLVFRLYTSNPFYVISADLVFVGLRMSFNTEGQTFETWALMLGLAGYTLLLAATACWLIRRGKVWDDARSLLLLVVMMFLAMSVTFDNTLNANRGLGTACFIGGFLFAVAVSEGLLRGIQLALPLWFRGPYYLILALFFLYPLGLRPLLSQPDGPVLQWALIGFPTLSGLCFLTLVPAIRRGPEYVVDNGSPWRWPLYPWVLFGLLAMAVCARASYLCVSFHFVDRTIHEATNSIFAPYFLIPFLFALNLLVLEAGIVARNRVVLRTALLVPLGLLGLAVLGHRPDPVYQRFLEIFMNGLGGSPLFLTTIAALAFYGFAAVRAVPMAYSGVAASLAALVVIGPTTLDLHGLKTPAAWPLLAIALLEAGMAYRRRDSWRGLSAAACTVTAIALVLPDGVPIARAYLVFQLALVAILALGAIFSDALARRLQQVGAGVLFLSGLAVILGDSRLFANPPQWLLDVYVPLVVAIAIGYGFTVGNRLFFVAAAALLVSWLTVVGWRSYLLLRQFIAGLDFIVWGLVFFVLAALISLKKAGAASKRDVGTRTQHEL